MPGADKEAVTIEPWAAGIGLAMLLVVVGMAIFTSWDRAHTAAIEEVITPTAVGDLRFIAEPPQGTAPLGLQYQGKKLDRVSESKMPDAKLLRVGMDDSGVYTLYRLEDEKETGHKQRLFMKVAVGDFIEVTQE